MAIGLGGLGLSPLVFWALTPRELDAALRGRFGAHGGAADFTRHDLSQLMQKFPD